MVEDSKDSGSEGGSPNRSRSNSKSSNHSGSRNSRSRSGSAASSKRSGSHSGGSRKSSRSGSAHSGSEGGSPNRSRSNSKSSNHSGSRNSRSRSGSAASSKRSRSNSGGSHKSSRSESAHSGSVPRTNIVESSMRSKSGSPASKRSKSGSPPSKRSKSGSPASKRSKSGSPTSKGSKSGSPSSKRSKSGSPASKTSKSGSPASKRSKSGSPASKRSGRSHSNDSNASGHFEKRKRKIISDSDSNEAPKQVVAKKNKLIDTDSEEDEVAQSQPADKSALFGDADDISTDEEGAAKSGSEKSPRKESDSERSRRSVSRSDSRDRGRSRSGSRRSSRDGDDDRKRRSEEREKTPIPETRIDVEIPRIASDLGKDIHFVKLPNFLSVDTRPFDPETYEDEIDEEETLDEEGRQRLKLKVGNTIRWRKFINDKGETVQDSNARFVRWSDGSLSLHLGSEIFDVYKQPLTNDNHLFIRQGTGLQGQAVFRTKLSFRPHSTDSFTHKKMTMSLADRSQKTAGIKILTQVGNDPDAERAENLKKEEEALRQVMRQRKPVKSKRTKRTSGANAGYGDHDEGSDDEGAISISAIKNKYKKGGAGADKPIYSSDENEDDASDGSDFDTRRKKKDKSKPTKALKDSDEESDNASAKHTGSENEASEKESATEHSDDE